MVQTFHASRRRTTGRFALAPLLLLAGLGVLVFAGPHPAAGQAGSSSDGRGRDSATTPGRKERLRAVAPGRGYSLLLPATAAAVPGQAAQWLYTCRNEEGQVFKVHLTMASVLAGAAGRPALLMSDLEQELRERHLRELDGSLQRALGRDINMRIWTREQGLRTYTAVLNWLDDDGWFQVLTVSSPDLHVCQTNALALVRSLQRTQEFEDCKSAVASVKSATVLLTPGAGGGSGNDAARLCLALFSDMSATPGTGQAQTSRRRLVHWESGPLLVELLGESDAVLWSCLYPSSHAASVQGEPRRRAIPVAVLRQLAAAPRGIRARVTLPGFKVIETRLVMPAGNDPTAPR